MFSDTDIKQEIDERRNNSTKGISIDPFEDKYLTPVGYDFRVGVKGFSWKNKREVDIEQERRIEIEPNDTVVIETLESISLSKEVGTTIHSMVSRAVLQGLSHISTTIDPGWTGKLLISIHNYQDKSVELRFKDSFCTVCFYKVESESKAPLGRPADRDDIWQSLLDKAKEEKDRQTREMQSQKRREKTEDKIRIVLTVAFILIVSFVGFQISFQNASLGAFLAVVSPILFEIFKRR